LDQIIFFHLNHNFKIRLINYFTLQLFTIHFIVEIPLMNYSIAKCCFNQFNLSDNFTATKVMSDLSFCYSWLHSQFDNFEIVKKLSKVLEFHWCFAAVVYCLNLYYFFFFN